MPVIPLLEVAGSNGAGLPVQILGSAVKVGVVFGVIVCVSVAVTAHCPASGVNVYVPLAVLLTVAGDQVPVIPLVEVAGSIGAGLPLQIGASDAKLAVTGASK